MPTDGNSPNLYRPDDVYKAPYAARVDTFMRAGAAAGLTLARDDATTTALVLVDVQHDFVDPAGTLSVPGAQDDVARLLGWLYTNAGRVTRIYASLDTHLPLSIFYRAWWVSPETGQHPEPYTPITVEDVERGVWEPVAEREWSARYLGRLREQAKKDLMIWPEHTMEGTLGRMLTPALSEAIAWHSAGRGAQPVYIAKGRTPRTEFYGIFGAEVPDPNDSTSALDAMLLDRVMSHDRVYVAGEAKSHCVLETLRQIVARYQGQPDMLAKVHVLRDCMSSVAHPAIDFDALAETAFDEMSQASVRFVTSADGVE
jgi:nicotinamidase-related amidase